MLAQTSEVGERYVQCPAQEEEMVVARRPGALRNSKINLYNNI